MPGRGRIAIFFGSWYADPMIRRTDSAMKKKAFDRALDRIVAFEKMLSDDGALILKIWLHVSRKEQKKALKKLDKEGRVTELDWERHRHYEEIVQTAERAIARTHSDSAPWHIVEAADTQYRDYTVGSILLTALKQKLEATSANALPAPHVSAKPTTPPPASRDASILDKLDLSQTLPKAEFEEQLPELQNKLYKLAWEAHRDKRSMVLVFEGWDAAGKGGAIQRVVEAMDPRLYKVVGIAAPTDEEKAQHYLWRFWRHIPRPGSATLFDRSWYGRVLVERVEGFATVPEWTRAYSEINAFEEQLVESGIVLLKFWLHISPEEQLRRFKERESTAYKQYKITAEDWRNREKWPVYEAAVNEMATRCSTNIAPWTLVEANDKRFARVKVLKTIINALKS
jgi:polyphosphate:AMP phosphotransferase